MTEGFWAGAVVALGVVGVVAVWAVIYYVRHLWD